MSEPPLTIALAYRLYDVVLCGKPTPNQKDVLDYMTGEPQPGDLVMETSTIWHRNHDPVRLGKFVRCVREPCPDWDEAVDGPNPGEKVWYITSTIDASEFRWLNANFIRIPEGLRLA